MGLADLIEQKIEDIMGLAPGVVPRSALAPMFRGDGSPILKSDGSQLCLSYAHAAVYDAHLLKGFGKAEATETQTIAEFPLLFSRSTAVHLLTKDGYAIFGMRSNFSPNLPGAVLSVAGGFSKILQDGKPEDILQCAWRVLASETCLNQANVSGKMHHLWINHNPIIRYEIGEQKLPGRVLDLESELVVISDRPAKELVKDIRLSDQHIGTVVMPLNLLRSPNDKPKGAGFVPILGRVDFYPAMDLLRRMTYDGGKKCLADMLRENMYLGLLRRDLASVLRPQDIPGPKEAEWKLGNSIKVKISPKDFITGQGEAEPLLVARRAAQQFGLIAPQS